MTMLNWTFGRKPKRIFNNKMKQTIRRSLSAHDPIQCTMKPSAMDGFCLATIVCETDWTRP